MGKIAQQYLEVHPWKIVESGFHEKEAIVSESLFSLSNEYMGVRGFFDEGYIKDTLIGTYYNGLYEIPQDIRRSHYKGISDKMHYMVNAANIFYTRIYLNDEILVFNPNDISHFERSLDFKTGEMVRSYQVKDLFKITFKRLLDMKTQVLSHQMIHITPLQYQGPLSIDFGIDFDTNHWGKPGYWKVVQTNKHGILGETSTNQLLYVSFQLSSHVSYESSMSFEHKCLKETISFNLTGDVYIEKNIVSIVDKEKIKDIKHFEQEAQDVYKTASYAITYASNQKFYEAYFAQNDIIIKGDEKNQQGIRYCLFQLVNTYQGVSEKNNIGAKGLTGEAYSGHAFWDSETYCLPVYLFTNPKAARNLLMFRYNTLEQARKRAMELDCAGACYPIATLNGDEACDLWQHASLQFQPTSAVAYAIWHYVKNTKDTDFLLNYGFEMLLEIARFFASRGQYNQDQTKFGYYGVMGPDEFQMMVNHNAYTNLLAKKSMTYFLEVYETYQNEPVIDQVIRKLKLKKTEISDMKEKCEKMYMPFDQQTRLFEQHEGFFDLPHIDIHQIPVTDFPLYAHWSYDRIYRNDMIKQPDVLMFLFLYNQSYDLEIKKANYDYYEPKTIHESSLSPSIHSILASELGYKDEALNFFGFATRMDLDDYNRNTKEGLHLTSIAAAWVNIVYGFGGLRSDGEMLKLAPYCPKHWENYEFKFHYFNANIKVYVDHEKIELELDQDLEEPILIYEEVYYFKKGKAIIHVDR
ncbi:MAG: family 65 glycosyl hydrolase [Tenericutes bacterium HGW-Tenericutes-6]|jgi:maltose phosphorylase|nr:MAG: family 65 glycosyl hydrolase [Tenericutes bacterium HGW-Tenericutes-6]